MTINHVAIIMDGNGRWASANNTSKLEGHKKGASVAKDIIKHSANIGIKHLTLYAFSFENWKRPAQEVHDILGILSFYLKNQINELHKHNIKFKLVGNTTTLDKNLQDLVKKAENLTTNNDAMTIYLAFSYGGKDEIIRACKKILESTISPDDLTSANFAQYLDSPEMPDVDLMLRTSGETRTSNFLIWQSAYAELYFTKTLWPDFTTQDFDTAIQEFYKRKRNFGYAREHTAL